MWSLSRLPAFAIFTAVALLLLALAAPALAASGDYGVNTGASAAATSCGNESQPACTLLVNGYGLTFSHISGVFHVYTFDDFDCTVYIHSGTGGSSARGDECDQYQP